MRLVIDGVPVSVEGDAHELAELLDVIVDRLQKNGAIPVADAVPTCPPHHWKIDKLTGDETVGGICRKCGMRRSDFDPQINYPVPAARGVARKCKRCGQAGHDSRKCKAVI